MPAATSDHLDPAITWRLAGISAELDSLAPLVAAVPQIHRSALVNSPLLMTPSWFLSSLSKRVCPGAVAEAAVVTICGAIVYVTPDDAAGIPE
eukprot:CAMPEP_0171190468 /NCGR_PEP_ID=MMETSP0790-20130122/18871_1 /TAXON_ID=2925 /ORGANISM="Alexandrium catenella, Strain OF101" /LENGTH=92 /DNA_ID=CAMNT_0011655599 /DNA_START=86 /DNA_END=364 /DNA_ORIENTATION=-